MGRTPAQRPRQRHSAVSLEERDQFLQAVVDARPLAASARDRLRLPAPPAPRPKARSPLPPPVPLVVERDGAVVGARRRGVNRAQLAELRGGRIRPEATLDLHGLGVAAAEERLAQFVVEAARLRRRCVLVIHGRGLHSGGVAMLRDAVIAALAGPMSGLVHAWSTAARHDGGDGATYVMVRG
jgi:DNA-nicking Smr family endonuclease